MESCRLEVPPEKVSKELRRQTSDHQGTVRDIVTSSSHQRMDVVGRQQ